jgi:cysteine-rich repeat protein
MKKKTMYWLLAWIFIILSSGTYRITTNDNLNWWLTAFKTQSASNFDCADANTGIPISECEALMALYTHTNGDNWTNKSNWLNVNNNVSTWYGVIVSNGHVIKLELQNNALSGSIPHKISQLSYLEELYLNNNNVSGAIPQEIGELVTLQRLFLFSNKLTGPIPKKIGELSKLKHLALAENQLSGPIPKEIGQLRQLEQLYLYKNQLSGPIPTEISDLTNLFVLSLNNNQLCWLIPNKLINLSNLNTQLYIYWNNLFDDQNSYSQELWQWLKARNVINPSTNRIRQQTPTACDISWWNEGQIWDSCMSNEECTSGTCELIFEWSCQSWNYWNIIFCTQSAINKAQCEWFKQPRWQNWEMVSVCIWQEKVIWWVCVANCGNGIVEWDEECDDTNLNNGDGCSKECQIEVRKICGDGVCSASENSNNCPSDCAILCWNGVLESWEQCDGIGQAQCSKWATCSTTWKAPCMCQYSEVIDPDKLLDTTASDREKPWTKEESKTTTFPTTRTLTR